jgi:hypothetical protein
VEDLVENLKAVGISVIENVTGIAVKMRSVVWSVERRGMGVIMCA